MNRDAFRRVLPGRNHLNGSVARLGDRLGNHEINLGDSRPNPGCGDDVGWLRSHRHSYRNRNRRLIHIKVARINIGGDG